jgi:hypothetical protein
VASCNLGLGILARLEIDPTQARVHVEDALSGTSAGGESSHVIESIWTTQGLPEPSSSSWFVPQIANDIEAHRHAGQEAAMQWFSLYYALRFADSGTMWPFSVR